MKIQYLFTVKEVAHAVACGERYHRRVEKHLGPYAVADWDSLYRLSSSNHFAVDVDVPADPSWCLL